MVEFANTSCCATLAHLQWTLAFSWNELDAPRVPLRSGWAQRATQWRANRSDSPAWEVAVGELPAGLSWAALRAAHARAGLDPAFRTGPAFCRRRRYGWRPGLAERFAAKLDRDAGDNVAPAARAIRGFLDIIHTHPFNDGNARAATTWLTWSLALAGHDVPDLGPLVRLPYVPANDRIPTLMLKGLR